MSRKFYLDNCKAITMLLIVFDHCGISDIYPFFYDWISTFHVPVFFIVSGILLYNSYKKGKLEYKVSKKVKSYLVPYLVFSLLFGIFINGIHVISGTASLNEAVLEIVNGLLSQSGCFTACWFLPCLFFAEFIFIFEHKNIKMPIAMAINVIFAVAVCIIPHENVFIKGIFRIFVGVFFLTIGYFFAILMEKYKIKREYMLISMPIFVLLSLLMTKLNGHVHTYGIEAGNSIFIYYFNAIIGSIALLFITKIFLNKEIKWLTWFGQNTLITLCTHQLVIEILWILDNHTVEIFHQIEETVTPFIMWIIVLLLNIPIVYIINKYFYFLLGRKNPKLS